VLHHTRRRENMKYHFKTSFGGKGLFLKDSKACNRFLKRFLYTKERTVVLGGVVVVVLATGPNVRGFEPGRGQYIFKGIRSTSSYGGEVKPSNPCCNIVRHVKEPFENEIFRRLN
jgi:hypothetical protein